LYTAHFNPGLEFDLMNEVGEGSLAEQEDVSTRPIGVVNIVDVGFLGSDEDVTARKAQEAIADSLLPPSAR
jgi:hypothetical protein